MIARVSLRPALVASIFLALLVTPLDAQNVTLGEGEYLLTVRAADGNQFTGVTVLPSFTVETKYGNMVCTPEQFNSLTRVVGATPEEKDTVQLSGQNMNLKGKCKIPDLTLKTANGTITIPGADIQYIAVSQRPPAKPTPVTPPTGAPPPPAAGGPSAGSTPPSGPAKSPWWVLTLGDLTPPGEARPTGSRAPEWHDLRRTSTAATEDGAFLAVVPPGRDAIWIVDTAAKKCLEAAVESHPVHVSFYGGQFWVCCAGASKIVAVDPKSGKVTARISTPAPPYCLAPAKSSKIAYAIMGDYAKREFHSIDLDAKRALGPFQNFEGNRPLTYAGGVAQTSDGRYVYVQGEFSHSPSGSPYVYMNRSGKLVQVNYLHDSTPPILTDLRTQRVYAGKTIYSLDLKMTYGTIPVAISTPAPDLQLVIGAITPQNDPWGCPNVITAYDAKTLTPHEYINLGEKVGTIGLYPGKNVVHVLTPTDYYAIPYSALLGHEVPTASASGSGEKPPAEAPDSGSGASDAGVDITKEVSSADQAKAKAAVAKGEAALSAGKNDEAMKAFTEAEKIDPLSSGTIGRAKTFVAQSKFDDAIGLLAGALATPYRDEDTTLQAYVALGSAYVGANRATEAVKTLQEGLKIDAKSARLLASLGTAAVAAKNDALAFCAWTRASKLDSCPASVKSDLATCTTRIKKETTEKCRGCDGEGQHEMTIEESNGQRKKMITKCDSCKGAKQTWKRPCADCWGSSSYYNECEKCWGRGYILEPAK